VALLAPLIRRIDCKRERSRERNSNYLSRWLGLGLLLKDLVSDEALPMNFKLERSG